MKDYQRHYRVKRIVEMLHTGLANAEARGMACLDAYDHLKVLQQEADERAESVENSEQGVRK